MWIQSVVSVQATLPSQSKDAYLKCVAEHKGKAEACTETVKAYLTCRMQRCV